jgi:hypothetical protein
MAHSHSLVVAPRPPAWVPPWARGLPIYVCRFCGQHMVYSQSGQWLHMREGVIDPGPTTLP